MKSELLSKTIVKRIAAMGKSLRGVSLAVGENSRWLQRIKGKINWKLEDIEKIGKAIGVDLFYELADESTKQKHEEELARLEAAVDVLKGEVRAGMAREAALEQENRELKIKLEVILGERE